MKTINVDFSKENLGIIAREGELNRTQVVFSLDEDLQKCDFINVEFGINDSCEKPVLEYLSPDEGGNTLTIKLNGDMTVSGLLSMQLVGYAVDSETAEPHMIAKSPVVNGTVTPSIEGVVKTSKGNVSLLDRLLAKVHTLLEKAHTHSNAKTLDKFYCDLAEAEGEEFPILPDYIGVDRLKYNGIYLAYCSDGGMIEDTEEWSDPETDEKFFRIHLNNGPMNTGRRDWIDIPISGTKEVSDGEPGIGTQSAGIQLQLGGTEESSTIPIVTALPETAKFGDICKYARANNLSTDDAGKTIYFDNDWINQVGATYENATELHWYMPCNSGNFDISITSNGLPTESKLRVDITSRDYGCTLYYQGDNDGKLSLITDGSVSSFYVDSNGRVTITEMPKSLPIPDDVYTKAINDTAPFIFFRHTPKLMIYLDKWVEFPDIPTKTSELENDSNFVTSEQLNTAMSEIQGGIDEIETLIDNSGVLDE